MSPIRVLDCKVGLLINYPLKYQFEDYTYKVNRVLKNPLNEDHDKINIGLIIQSNERSKQRFREVSCKLTILSKLLNTAATFRYHRLHGYLM